MDMINGGAPGAGAGAAPNPVPKTPPRTLPRSTYDLHCPTLLPANRTASLDMPIPEFCAEFELVRTIEDKLIENGYLHARFLRFVTIEELKQMKFLLGEIAAIRDGVDRWSNAP